MFGSREINKNVENLKALVVLNRDATHQRLSYGNCSTSRAGHLECLGDEIGCSEVEKLTPFEIATFPKPVALCSYLLILEAIFGTFFWLWSAQF